MEKENKNNPSETPQAANNVDAGGQANVEALKAQIASQTAPSEATETPAPEQTKPEGPKGEATPKKYAGKFENETALEEGYVNLDENASVTPDVIHDLEKFPYPFPDSHFGLIEADHVLEHVKDPFVVMAELHRILKDEGNLFVKVPHFSRGFTHPAHKCGFDVSFFYYFKPVFKFGREYYLFISFLCNIPACREISCA